MKKVFKVKLTEEGVKRWNLSKRKLRETFDAFNYPGDTGIIIFVSKRFIRSNGSFSSWPIGDGYDMSKHYKNKYSDYGFYLNEGDYKYV